MQSPFRFGSFAPERKECRATWFVDGKTYFEHLADSLEAAQHQIFITDWSLNPEVYLRRTQPVSSANRLDKILKRKAEEGVEIFVLLWFETASATKGTVNSMHAISKLRELHPTNIHALRHPGGRMKVMWTHHQKTVIIDQRIAYVGGIDLCFGRYDHQHHPLVDDCELALEFPGKDYYNPRFDDFHDLHRPFQDLLDRATQPRMPWHDIHSYIDGEAAVDVAQNFIVRWNHHLGKARRKDPSITSPEIHELPRYEENVMNKRGTCRVQIVRSLSQWSSGLPYKEASVHAAYVSLIENAQHFIYIENQYFISAENQVAVTLRERIARAISNKEVFRAYICVPITPCGQWESTSIKYVMKWQYKTINKDILNPLRERFPGVPVNDYVSFYSFRTAARLGNQVVSDQVYIHSKLMIVDDRVAVIGSANINDRSLCGDRDSEIVAIIEDEEYVESQMNGNFYLASRFAHSLRVSLFSEHLGLLSDDGTIENRSELLNQINDPICEDTFKFWGATALSNKRIFDTLCPDAPRDGIDSFALLRQIREMEPAPFEKRLELLSKLRGHLITYPLLFLQNDTFEERGVVVENIVPDYVFQ